MSTRTVRNAGLLAVGLLFISTTDASAKLAYNTDDLYVRHASVILVGKAVDLVPRNGVQVAVVEPESVLLGAVGGSRIEVRTFSFTDEDMPVFALGDRALLFLVVEPEAQSTYSCIGFAAGKRDWARYGAVEWQRLLNRVQELVDARGQRDSREQVAALIRLLDSPDAELAAAASSYLNYLVNGKEQEDWVELPPSDSSDWSWKDYSRRNLVAHRKQWKRWWSERSSGAP